MFAPASYTVGNAYKPLKKADYVRCRSAGFAFLPSLVPDACRYGREIGLCGGAITCTYAGILLGCAWFGIKAYTDTLPFIYESFADRPLLLCSDTISLDSDPSSDSDSSVWTFELAQPTSDPDTAELVLVLDCNLVALVTEDASWLNDISFSGSALLRGDSETWSGEPGPVPEVLSLCEIFPLSTDTPSLLSTPCVLLPHPTSGGDTD